jgi:exodeoxyribonuclease-3
VTLRVVSYNIHEGGRERVEAIATVVSSQRADAVALLEAADRTTAEALGRELGMTLVYGEANNGMAVAWLSRLPVRRAESHRLPALAKTLLELEVASGAGVVRLFATHLASRHDEPAHSRREEVHTILRVFGSLGTVPHLLVGDLNSLRPLDPVGTPPPGVVKRGEALDGAPRPVIRHLLAAGYVDCYRAQHPDSPGYTYPTEARWLRLDYIFAAPLLALRLKACEVVYGQLATSASDHFPIMAASGDQASVNSVAGLTSIRLP